MAPFPFKVVATGIVKISASWTTSSQAWEMFTPPPATITGRSPSAKAFATALTSSRSGLVLFEGYLPHAGSTWGLGTSASAVAAL